MSQYEGGQLGGVKPMAIAGRVAAERERCIGMTDVERSWRKQWLQDQILAPHEPVEVPEYWTERTNILRRIYRKPLDLVFSGLVPMMGQETAGSLRYVTGKFFMIGAFILGAHYYFKYNRNDWTRKGGWTVFVTKPTVLPGQPGFPYKNPRCRGNDYADRGFKQSNLYN